MKNTPSSQDDPKQGRSPCAHSESINDQAFREAKRFRIRCKRCKARKPALFFLGKDAQLMDICQRCANADEKKQQRRKGQSEYARRKRLKEQGRFKTLAEIQAEAAAMPKQYLPPL